MRSALTRMLWRYAHPGRLRELRRLEPVQWLPPDRLADLSRNRLTDLLRYACREVPFYRDLCADSGLDPARVTADDLPAFPTLGKADLSADQARFLAGSRTATQRIASASGGSTGIIFRFYVDRAMLDIRTANALRGECWTGWRPGDRQAVLWGHPRETNAMRSLRGRVAAKVLHRSLNLNAFAMDEPTVARFVERLREWRPVMIRGYATALAYLADYAAGSGVDLPAPRGIISTAETLAAEHRASIERSFLCPVLNRYGSREFSCVAQQCERVGDLHVFTDRLHLEVLRPDGSPCDPKERGEIVLTGFDNRVMPLIRYRTGDLARGGSGACACGRSFPLLAAIEGRTSELIVGANGQLYACPGPTFWTRGVPGVHQMQIYQPDRERIEVRVVPGPQWSEAAARLLTARFHELLGPLQVAIVLRDGIPVSASGKYRFAISEVSPFNCSARPDPPR